MPPRNTAISAISTPIVHFSNLAPDGTMSLEQFTQAVMRRNFLKNVVSSYRELQGRCEFATPADYDFSRSTNFNHRHAEFSGVDAVGPLHGEFHDLRATRNYNYHVNYTEARQLWQDQVVRSIVTTGSHRQSEPWIIFMCGAMGVGKGHVMRYMSEQGHMPLENIVWIDPDHIKYMMPEWDEYVKRGTAAGNLCHRESGFIQELAQEAALRNGQNIWVDGSLRDGNWFKMMYGDLRHRFPSYRIAIFYIKASDRVVRERIAKRSRVTGRSVPESLVRDSLEAPDRSLGLLTPLVDFVARINNESDDAPVLESFEKVDNSGDWGAIQTVFGSSRHGRFGDPQPPTVGA